ncbi:VOC family protein [Acidicapsa ligni]|uniref:VOC family protein n=1 Tax=Acidicapsa ligni TaxID=542300 RepID=UPI0021E0DEC0|nr:VOC family protein [Acidicapsa ligni]
MSNPQGKFGWYELMTTDTDAAGAFYSNVVGWTTQAVGGPDMPYTTFNIGGTGVAGMMKLPEMAGSKPSWIGYIHVDDVDAYVDKVTAAGGKLHKAPFDVPGMLRLAVFADPQGAAFILFTSNPAMPTPPNRPAAGSPGTISWHELMATNGAAAFDFYTKLFGWAEAGSIDMGPMGAYQMFLQDGKPSGGIMTKPAEVPAPFWTFYFQVDNINAAIERLKAGGGSVINGPHQVPGDDWIVQALDPQGGMFALVSKTA